jgi:hypothetical protein
MALMVMFLRLIRIWRTTWRRTAEGKPPHWLSDLLDLADWANMVPTALAILLVPEHLFARTAEIRRYGSKIYKTPVKFMVSTVPVLLGLHHFNAPAQYKSGISWSLGKILGGLSLIRDILLRKHQLSGALFLEGFTRFVSVAFHWVNKASPCEIMLLALVGIPFLVPLFSILIYVLLLIPAACRLIGEDTACAFLIPVDPRTYFRMDWNHYGWNLFYFSVYFLVGFPVSVSAIYFSAEAPHSAVLGPGLIQWAWAAWQLIFNLACYGGAIVMPYNELLTASVTVPTVLMQTIKLSTLRKHLSQLDKSTLSTHLLLEYIAVECKRLGVVLTRYSSAARCAGEKWSELLTRETQRCYAMIPMRSLRTAGWVPEAELCMAFIMKNRGVLTEIDQPISILRGPLRGWRRMLLLGVAAAITLLGIFLIFELS